MNNQNKILFGAIALTFVAAGQAFLITRGIAGSVIIRGLLGIGVIYALGLALAGYHITYLQCSPFISVQTIFIKYLVSWVFKLTQRKYWKAFERSTKMCAEEQATFLMNKIREHENTTYGQDFRFKEIVSVDDFIRQHPLTKYEHYKTYIDSVARGELGVMSHRKARIMGKTSGTTGEAKLYPVSAEFLADFGGMIGGSILALQKKSGFEPTGPLQMSCNLLTGTFISATEGGIPIGPVTSFIWTDDVKKLLFSTPPECSNITHEPTAMYVHAIFALRDRNLGGLFAPFASSIFVFFQILEENWESVVLDIRRGWMSDNFTSVSESDRQIVNAHLEPMPERADELQREFRKGFDGIAERIWPHIPFLVGGTTGAMQTYAGRLKKYIGDLRILSGLYVSTEGIIGVACEWPADGQTKYVSLPNNLFYEFIPASKCDEDDPETVLLHNVQVGESYELVITNKDGLYRFRMGDVVEITGFFNQAPIFQFLYRNGELMNLRSEKTTEISIKQAIMNTISTIGGISLVDFSCADSPLYEEAIGLDTGKLYYVIFLELTASHSWSLGGAKQSQKFADELDSNLRRHSTDYDKFRQMNALDSLHVVFLDASAYEHFRDELLRRSGASPGQFKLPRKLSKIELIEYLVGHELKTTFERYSC